MEHFPYKERPRDLGLFSPAILSHNIYPVTASLTVGPGSAWNMEALGMHQSPPHTAAVAAELYLW